MFLCNTWSPCVKDNCQMLIKIPYQMQCLERQIAALSSAESEGWTFENENNLNYLTNLRRWIK